MEKNYFSKTTAISAYTGLVSVVGLIIITLACANLPKDIVGFGLFFALAGVAELGSVELFRSSRNSSVSVSMVVAVAGILVFGALGAALIHAFSGLMTIVTMSILHRNSSQEKSASIFRRSFFNVGMFAISAFLAGEIYYLVGGSIGNVSRFANLIPLIVAVLVNILINLAILIGIISLQTGRPFIEIWKQDFEWGVPINTIGAIIGGGALGLAYEQTGIVGLIAFFVPVFSVGYSFRLYVSHTREYVNKLEELNTSLDKANMGLLETLGAVVDAYDEYTYRHSSQVARYGSDLAKKLGLSKQDCAEIRKAGLIHDIGKIGIQDSIIGKSGPLTEDEYSLIKRHPVIGANIIRSMDGLQNLIPVVRHHHEHWDGTGYPAGLAGEEIPLSARIISLADSLDAMCSERPYRRPKSLDEVKQEIAKMSGKQFDPQVVEAFFELLAEKGSSFLENSASKVCGLPLQSIQNNPDQPIHYLKKSMIINRT